MGHEALSLTQSISAAGQQRREEDAVSCTQGDVYRLVTEQSQRLVAGTRRNTMVEVAGATREFSW